jgi:hypothetical protein
MFSIKPLEWSGRSSNGKIHKAYVVPMEYWAWENAGFGYWSWGSLAGREVYGGLDGAKAAAQADYESRIFSALSTPPAAAETNESAEARLREALTILDERLRACGSLYTAEDAYDSLCREIVSEALSAVGDEAKKSEGCICQNQHRRGYCTEPGCPYAVRPSSQFAYEAKKSETCERCQGNGEIVKDWETYLHPASLEDKERSVAECPDCDGTGSHPSSPTADRREIVARLIRLHVGCGYERADSLHLSLFGIYEAADAILAALDGGAGE